MVVNGGRRGAAATFEVEVPRPAREDAGRGGADVLGGQLEAGQVLGGAEFGGEPGREPATASVVVADVAQSSATPRAGRSARRAVRRPARARAAGPPGPAGSHQTS